MRSSSQAIHLIGKTALSFLFLLGCVQAKNTNQSPRILQNQNNCTSQGPFPIESYIIADIIGNPGLVSDQELREFELAVEIALLITNDCAAFGQFFSFDAGSL